MLTAFAITDRRARLCGLFVSGCRGAVAYFRRDENPQRRPWFVLRVRRVWGGDRGRRLFRMPDGRSAAGFLIMIVAAMAIGALLGLVLERGVLRLVYGRDEIVIVLVTYAAFLILEDAITLIWGQQLLRGLSADGGGRHTWTRRPGPVELRHRPGGVAGLVGAAAYWALNHTRWGRLLTVVIFDRETAAAFGINVAAGLHRHLRDRRHAGRARRRRDGAENLGDARHRRRSHRAGLRGGGDRWHGVDRRRDDRRVIVGLCRAAAVHLLPQLELFVIYAVMALVLVFRPYGLFAPAAAAEDLTMRRAPSPAWCLRVSSPPRRSRR